MQRAAVSLNRYPDLMGRDLVANLSVQTGVEAERIVLGSGSNELLFVSTDLALTPDTKAIAPAPGFSSYPKAITMRGGYVGISVRADGVVDVDAMLAAVTPDTRLAFVASPNNPTGGLLEKQEIERLVDRLPDHVFLHFDEAYYEFGQRAGAPDALPILQSRSAPWITTRSFSKAYNLAGARIGYGIASSKEVADAYRNARIPFSINTVALAGASAALDDRQHLDALLDQTIAERERMSAMFAAIGLPTLPSAANFVMVLIPEPPERIAAALSAENIFVIPVLWSHSPGAFRVSVGTPEDTEAVVEAIGRLLGRT
jgi:histidinol-phosphate aminotransferase